MLEETTSKCPFCGIGEIKIRCRQPSKIMRNVKSSERTVQKPVYISGKYTVISPKCPNCGKTKKEIQKILNAVKQPSLEEAAKRAKESGLPLKF